MQKKISALALSSLILGVIACALYLLPFLLLLFKVFSLKAALIATFSKSVAVVGLILGAVALVIIFVKSELSLEGKGVAITGIVLNILVFTLLPYLSAMLVTSAFSPF